MALFFSFDGIDGAGKTTQIERFRLWLDEQGREVVVCRDPGSTPLGEKLRQLLLESDASLPIGARSEMLVYMAARAQLVEQVIRPALAAGKDVVSDRFLLANIVYQGYAGGLDVDEVQTVGRIAIDGTAPHCTFLLDIAVEKTVDRIGDDLDRIERRGTAYRRKLREGFLAEAAKEANRIHVVDAADTVDAIATRIRRIAAALIKAETA